MLRINDLKIRIWKDFRFGGELEMAMLTRTLTVLALFLPVVAWGQSNTAPSYIDSMSDYEVGSLEGSLGPASGKLSMESITPSEWLTNDPGWLNGVIQAWSGGAKGIGSKLIVHGGGHKDSANNGVYIFDFDGTDRPKGWDTPLVISNLADVRQNSHTYSDGKPTSVHTYDGAVYAHHNNHMYRFMGSQHDNGYMTNSTFKFDLATNQWTQLPNFPDSTAGAKTIYDPVSGKIFVTWGPARGYFFRTATDTWSGTKNFSGNGFQYNDSAAWDSSRNRGIIVGAGGMNVLALDFSNETVSVNTFNPSGSTEIFSRAGISIVYDPHRDVYWIFGGDDNSPGWTNIYEMKAGTWAVTKHSLSGAAIIRMSGMIGSWGRYVFMDQWRAIGVVASITSPVYVIKLPGELIVDSVPPASPSGLNVQ
jgi:hypothetical protein